MPETIFLYLYPLVSTLGFAGYLPQIRNLIIAQEMPKGLSLAMWCFWLAEQSITSGYGIFHLKDLMFVILSLMDVGFLLTILLLSLYLKHIKFAPSKIRLLKLFAPNPLSQSAANK